MHLIEGYENICNENENSRKSINRQKHNDQTNDKKNNYCNDDNQDDTCPVDYDYMKTDEWFDAETDALIWNSLERRNRLESLEKEKRIKVDIANSKSDN